MIRNEYPRPQMVREKWTNLNGQWDFLFDFSKSGVERKLYIADNFKNADALKINVPFCPESKLSGICYTDFMPAVWYMRDFILSEIDILSTIILHFGAVDYKTKIWINGNYVGEHIGGYSSFSFDISEYIICGSNTLVVYAEDDNRSGKQPIGKQSITCHSQACSYTRTTGIWQTVWLEFVPQSHVTSYRVYPNVPDSNVRIDTFVKGDGVVSYKVYYKGKEVGTAKSTANFGVATAVITLSELHIWDIGKPELYDLEITFNEDRVNGYFGMRSVDIRPDALYLNGRPFYMRTILDQGFNSDGIYTAPNDEFLKRDIELAMELGFNGARLHQRVFEERTLYWADKLGYIIWGEYANGSDISSPIGVSYFLPEWIETVKRDFNHPSIIGWCINNESYWMKDVNETCQNMIFDATKELDPTRPVIDASGGVHFKTDMFDVHDYTHDPDSLKSKLAPMLEDDKYFHNPIHQQQLSRNIYKGQPYWVSEYGGIFWNPDLKPDEYGWGYGVNVKTEEEFAERYEGLTSVLLENRRVCGFCYTQLTDIEQEQNGLYKYDRSRKFSDEIYERIRKANTSEAAIEKKK